MDKKHETTEKLLRGPLVVVNIGLEKFAQELEKQNVEVLHVEYRPPAGGDQEMIRLLDQLL
jgi:FdrA protein